MILVYRHLQRKLSGEILGPSCLDDKLADVADDGSSLGSLELAEVERVVETQHNFWG